MTTQGRTLVVARILLEI